MKKYLLILIPLLFIGLQGCNTPTDESAEDTTHNVDLEETPDEVIEEIEVATDPAPVDGTEVAEDTEETVATDYTYVVETDFDNLKKALANHYKEAKAKNQTPFVYFTASWCPPCQAIKQYKNDPAMMDAYAGTYIVELDYDEIPDDISEEFTDGAIPAWSGFNADGSTNDLWVDGGAWGANIPENMAPVLKHYFNYTGDPFDYYPI